MNLQKFAHRDTLTVRKDYRGSLALTEMPFSVKLLVKRTIESIFQNQIDVLRVMKPAIQTKDVRVLQTELNLHLPLQLMMNFVLLHLFLRNKLQCNNIFALQKPNKSK